MTKPKTQAAPAAKAGKTLAEFRAQHDKNFIVPEKINKGLAKLGPEGWENELEFLAIAGLSTTDLAMFRDQFADFWVNVGTERQPKRVWAGTKAFAAKLRGMR